MDDFVTATIDLRLPEASYVVVGSSVLTACGMRGPNDIDLVVSGDVYDELKQEGGWRVEIDPGFGESLRKDDFHVMTTWSGRYDLIELFLDGFTYNGVRFANPDRIIEWKEAFRAKQDHRDLQAWRASRNYPPKYTRLLDLTSDDDQVDWTALLPSGIRSSTDLKGLSFSEIWDLELPLSLINDLIREPWDQSNGQVKAMTREEFSKYCLECARAVAQSLTVFSLSYHNVPHFLKVLLYEEELGAWANDPLWVYQARVTSAIDHDDSHTSVIDLRDAPVGSEEWSRGMKVTLERYSAMVSDRRSRGRMSLPARLLKAMNIAATSPSYKHELNSFQARIKLADMLPHRNRYAGARSSLKLHYQEFLDPGLPRPQTFLEWIAAEIKFLDYLRGSLTPEALSLRWDQTIDDRKRWLVSIHDGTSPDGDKIYRMWRRAYDTQRVERPTLVLSTPPVDHGLI
jgi:hypothetical protein